MSLVEAQKILEASEPYQKVDMRFYPSNEEGYVIPQGGGGVSDAYRAENMRVEFGHGGTHLTDLGLDADYVHRILANDVLGKNLEKGKLYEFRINIDGNNFIYRANRYKDDVINIGTYFKTD